MTEAERSALLARVAHADPGVPVAVTADEMREWILDTMLCRPDMGRRPHEPGEVMRPPTPTNDPGAALVILGVYAPESLPVGEIALAMSPGVLPASAHRHGASAAVWTANRASRIRLATVAVNELILQGYAECDGEDLVRATIKGAALARTWGVKP